MKKMLLPLLGSAVLLSACTPLFNNGGWNPDLKQLKGQHISVVRDRINNWADVETGMFGNKYFLYRACPYSGRDMVSTNYWGVEVGRQPIYNCGESYFTTNKDGVITDYLEVGYTPNTNYQQYFRDLIVIKK
ncbi:hypothetical protein ACWA5Z_07345 [Testudinibacter sp. P80/BLE/0925]|uniref:hypothetical protein n=1 Tax=Testudinibacter sp. TW-1 TaxID=3417757 RepID=UPI003D360B1A